MAFRLRYHIFVALLAMTHLYSVLPGSLPAAVADYPVYQNPEAPIADRVEDLLSRMTIDEKIGQMTQLNISEINVYGDHGVELDPEKAREILTEYHVGSFLNGFAVTAREWYEFIHELQTIAVEKTRLGIPVIYGIDHMHGASYLLESTIFPHNINLANTFNTGLARAMGAVTTRESAHLGHHWNFAPVLDIGRDPRWPRFYETFGEDPWLASVLGVAYTEGLQEESSVAPYRMAATAKHFIGYSTPHSGMDRAPVDMSDQMLQEIHRPPFQASIDAGVQTVMVNSGELNGVPVHASRSLLTDLLRDEMGFQGVVLTDWADIIKLTPLDRIGYQQEHYHHAAHDEKEATLLAIQAGIDMSMTPQSLNYLYLMRELVDEGKISEERLDESVRRILRLKFELGLFENPYPTTDFFHLIGKESHKAKALQAARESLVLLENKNNLLPLNAETAKTILLTGPRANSRRDLSGGWTLEWQGGPEESYPDNIHTIYSGLETAFPNSDILLITSPGKKNSPERRRFLEAADRADVIIMALGEEPYSEFVGDITDITLYSDQQEIADVVVETGKPHVLVLVGGRPRVLSETARNSNAILWTGLPGFKGGEAIADVLSGRFNPSGRLSFTYPYSASQFTTYDHKPTGIRVMSAWEFGHGLSYTDFSWSNLSLSADHISSDEELIASVDVLNTGDRAGQLNVLWFLRNEIGLITRPVRQLRHFEKIELEPGESKTVSFRIVPDKHLYYPDPSGYRVAESGFYTLTVGDQTARFRLEVPHNIERKSYFSR